MEKYSLSVDFQFIVVLADNFIEFLDLSQFEFKIPTYS